MAGPVWAAWGPAIKALATVASTSGRTVASGIIGLAEYVVHHLEEYVDKI